MKGHVALDHGTLIAMIVAAAIVTTTIVTMDEGDTTMVTRHADPDLIPATRAVAAFVEVVAVLNFEDVVALEVVVAVSEAEAARPSVVRFSSCLKSRNK